MSPSVTLPSNTEAGSNDGDYLAPYFKGGNLED